MLGSSKLIAFVSTKNPDLAKAFYSDELGLRLLEDTPVALVFDAAGTMLRVSKVPELKPAPYTVLGWKVPDTRAAVHNLISRGSKFERYPGITQDELGVWTRPGGQFVTWFKDPDGNTLSLTQFQDG